jgi:hypothetical protein
MRPDQSLAKAFGKIPGARPGFPAFQASPACDIVRAMDFLSHDFAPAWAGVHAPGLFAVSHNQLTP